MKIRQIGAVLLAVGVLNGNAALAAEWREGLGPAQPYAGVPEVNLEETMGYTMLFPRENMPASYFCDVLEFYLPREDVERGEGKLQLYDENGLVYECDFTDEAQVEIRPLQDEELEGLMWGGGTCVTVHLPVSLTAGGNYYVHMDEGCFTAAQGKVKSLSIVADDAWKPVVSGDFAVNGLRYYEGGAALLGDSEEPSSEGEAAPAQTAAGASESAAGSTQAADSDSETVPEQETGEDGQTAESDPVPEVPDFSELPVTLTPHAGDSVVFDIVMGGDASSVVVYSENNSVEFEVPEYSVSAKVAGKVLNDEINWGLVFLNENGDVLDILSQVKG